MNSLLIASRSAEPASNGWSPIGHGWSPIGRLEFDRGSYRFSYTNGARTAAGFTPFNGMENLEEIYESNDLFPIFANRLLPKSRPEYKAYLRWSGFDPANPPDPIAVLGVTEGIRRTDMIELFPCPEPDGVGCYLGKFFLHGLRYMPDSAKVRVLSLQQDEPLYPMLDLCNPAGRNMVALRTDNADRLMLGYVPRYLAHTISKLVRGYGPEFLCALDPSWVPGLCPGIQIFTDLVNRDAPLQQRLLCRLRACWPEGFRPCSGEEFQPIPAIRRCEW